MLSNKTVLIVGAGGLLGSALVKSVLDSNASVIVADIDVAGMKSKLKMSGVSLTNKKLRYIDIDLTNEKSTAEIFNDFPEVSGAVNCTYPRNKTYGSKFLDVTLDSFNENTSLHLGSAFLFLKQCAKLYLRQNSPLSVVNIASVYGCVAPDFSIYDNTSMTMPVEYAAIKSAIIHLSKYATKFVGDSGFRVNSVSPGGILDGQPVEFLTKYRKQTLGKGMLDVEDVIGSVLFLLSEQSKYINGQNIVVDDGFTL